MNYEVYFPHFKEIEVMAREHGLNAFYKSIELRKLCCFIRKVEPLQRVLLTCKAWITGLRRSQSVTRAVLEIVEWDKMHDIVKLNPLVAWSEKNIWEYLKKEKVPYNALHDKGFPSIGCAPCTRAVKAGEDIRAGRWWWEKPEHKECGLHK